jgi:hypothetical protein
MSPTAGLQPTRHARIPQDICGSLLEGSRLSCGQRLGQVQSIQKRWLTTARVARPS